MPAEKKTHCKHGHPYEGENIGTYKAVGLTEKFRYRYCKTCTRERAKEQRERQKAGIPPGPRGRPVTDVCPQGHPKTLENLMISYTKKYRKWGEEYWYPVKYCKICHRASRKRTMERQKEAKRNGTS